MQKKYSLDYSIERDIDRLKAVEDIIDKADTSFSYADLEQLASYILYGKDENGLNAYKRGEITNSNTRYPTFRTKADKNESLDAILENPATAQDTLEEVKPKTNYIIKRSVIAKPRYDKKTGALIDPGDSDIPGMTELWEEIARLEHVVAVNDGKVPPDDSTQLFKDAYRYYQFKHMLVDVRRQQYYLKDTYKPTIHFVAVVPPKPQTYNWDSDSYYWVSYEQWKAKVEGALVHSISKNLDDYEQRINPNTGGLELKWVVREHHFDWENPKHVKALMNHYKLDSWGRTLIFDFDRYSTMANLSPMRIYMLTRRIDKASLKEIVEEVEEKFGVKYNENHLSVILTKEIPEKIAQTAKRHRMIAEWPAEDRKICKRCGQSLPRDTMFFSRNRNRKDGFSHTCKECERQQRIEKGEQSAYDRRSKEANLPQV